MRSALRGGEARKEGEDNEVGINMREMRARMGITRTTSVAKVGAG